MDALLGPKLHTKNGESSTVDVLKGKKAVLLYFSAHWCPPCRGFTPELAKFYQEHAKAKEFEIVFVSSDREEKQFEEYYAEHPWVALPYADRELKAKLSKKFKVQGIPTLIVLDAEGKVISSKGREMVSRDRTAKDFPWPTKSLLESIKGTKGVTNGGEEKELSAALSGKVFGFYFSAHWCPPCQKFTPKLVEAYNKLKAEGKPFEIVYVSNDRSPQQFKEYFEKMPWLAIPFDEDAAREELGETFEVQGIPHLVLFDENGKKITDDGTSAVASDEACAKFPWRPEAVADLDGGAAFRSINSEPCLVAFVAPEQREAARAALLPVANTYIAAAEAAGDDPAVRFFVAAGGDLDDAVRGFSGVKETPAVLYLDVPNVYRSPAADVSEAAVRSFVADALAGKLTPVERPE